MRSTWDTGTVPPRKGLDYWRDAVSQAFLPLEPETRAVSSFHGSIEKWATPSLSVSRVTSAECLIRRTKRGIAHRQDGSYFANLILSGSGMVSQFGRTETVSGGGIILVDTNEPFDLEFPDGLNAICVTLGHDVIGRYLPHEKRLSTSTINPRGTGGIARAYIATLATEFEVLDQGGELVAEQIAALLVRSCGRNPDRSPEGGRLRSSIVRRFEALIKAEISNPDLGAKRVCNLLGVSRSTLFANLAKEGVSLSGAIQGLRLRNCKYDLSNPDLKHLPVWSIAKRWGFRDPTSFSRSFRRATGISPGHFRDTSANTERSSVPPQSENV